MGKKLFFLLLISLVVFVGCSSTESKEVSKSDETTTESKEEKKEDSSTTQQSTTPVVDMRTDYLKDMNRELKRLYDALKLLQSQIDANRQDNQVSKTQAWKDEMSKGYSAVESANTNIKTYPADKIPEDLKRNHHQLTEGLGLLVKSKEFYMRGIPENNEEVVGAGNLFVKQDTNLVDSATNFILDQK